MINKEELDAIRKGMIFILYQMCLEQNFGQGFLPNINQKSMNGLKTI